MALSCIAVPATLAISPPSSGPATPGTTVGYSIAVTYHDIGACAPSRYDFFVDQTGGGGGFAGGFGTTTTTTTGSGPVFDAGIGSTTGFGGSGGTSMTGTTSSGSATTGGFTVGSTSSSTFTS